MRIYSWLLLENCIDYNEELYSCLNTSLAFTEHYLIYSDSLNNTLKIKRFLIKSKTQIDLFTTKYIQNSLYDNMQITYVVSYKNIITHEATTL